MMMSRPGELTFADRFFLFLAGVFIAALSWLWAPPFLPPELWEDVAVAAGLRPPEAAFPLLWQALVSPLFAHLGMAKALWVLQLAGHVSLGLSAMLMGGLLNQLLPTLLRFRMRRVTWSRRIVRILILQAVVFFCCADPVWRSGQYFSPLSLHLLLTFPAVSLLLRFLQTGVIPYVYFSSFFMGLLAADSPAGIVFGLIAGALSYWKALISEDMTTNPLANPLVRVVVQRRMTGCFFLGLLAGAGVNAWFFFSSQGLEALDWTGLTYLVHALYRYVHLVQDTATPIGWLFVALVAVAPLLVALYLLGNSTDDDKFLPYWCGLVFIGLGLFSFSQLSRFDVFWFWTWTGEIVRSPFLLSITSFLSTLTVTYALCVLGVEVYFRNNRRIAGQRYQDAAEEQIGHQTLASFRRFERFYRIIFVAEPLVALLCIIPGRMLTTERTMLGIVGDAAALTARECVGAERLFSDGAIDSAVEICATRDGHPLKVLSMMSGNTPRETWLRLRGVEDEEDRLMFSLGAADALRTWVRDKTNRVESIGVQLGFELWKRNKLPLPPVGGMVARPKSKDFDPQPGIAEAHDLAERILDCYKTADPNPNKLNRRRLYDVFAFVQWRLSAIGRVRADILDTANNTEKALEESELSDDLDEKNEAFKRIRSRMDWVNQQKSARLTPREGLRIGLDRANFSMARVFAQQILVSDPDDSPANFAMGMNYFVQEQYGRAEVYLKRSLLRNPDEPAVLNNLAVAQLRIGNLDEAETNALRALKAYPSSKDILRTLTAIRERQQKQAAASQSDKRETK